MQSPGKATTVAFVVRQWVGISPAQAQCSFSAWVQLRPVLPDLHRIRAMGIVDVHGDRITEPLSRAQC